MLFLVNLDVAIERRRFMTAQLDALGLEFERIGIDMRGRPRAEIADWVRSRFPSIVFDLGSLSCAEVGCWLSHLCAWQRLLEHHKKKSCVVIEDDVILDAEFPGAATALMAHDAHDVIFLGTSSKNISTRRRSRIDRYWAHIPIGTIYNTWGYSISWNYVARVFSTKALRIDIPIDHFLGGSGAAMRPKIAVLRPPVVEEDPVLGSTSQIGPHTLRMDRWGLVQRGRRRILASRVSDLYYKLYTWL